LVQPAPPEPERREPAPPESAEDGDLLRDVAARLMLYIHPSAAKTLQRYAVEQSGHRAKVKVHDLAIEALEEWFQRHGLPGPVRAKEPVPRSTVR
jgi:hypothetical protein